MSRLGKGQRLLLRACVLSTLISGVAVAEEQVWPPMDVPEGFELVDRVVAQVEGRLVTWSEVEKAVSTNQNLGVSGGGGVEAQRKEALRALIDEHLILVEAEKLQMGVSSEEIEQHLQTTRLQNNWSMQDLVENIARLGMTLDEYREVTRKEKTKSMVIGVKVGSRVSVSEAEVQRILDAEYGGGTREWEARVSILVRQWPTGANEAELQEFRRYGKWLHSQAEAAPELFNQLAKKFSDHEMTRPYGGDLGYFRKGAIAVPQLEEAAFSTPVGGVSGLLETSQGLMIVHVTDRRMVDVRDPDALRNTVFQKVYGEARMRAYQEWMDELRQSAFVRTRL